MKTRNTISRLRRRREGMRLNAQALEQQLEELIDDLQRTNSAIDELQRCPACGELYSIEFWEDDSDAGECCRCDAVISVIPGDDLCDSILEARESAHVQV